MLLLLLLSVVSINAQVTIGSTSDPHPASVLDLQSTTKGLKLPNVALDTDLAKFVIGTDAQKVSAKGMMVYNTTDNQVYFWNGETWALTSGNGTGGTDLPGTPGIWVNPTNGARGIGTSENPYVNTCPTSTVELTLQSGYSFGNISGGDISDSKATFISSGYVMVTKGSQSGTIYVTINSCAFDSNDYPEIESGTYSLSGTTCYDVAMHDGGETCGLLTSRTNTFKDSYTFIYSVVTSSVMSELEFVVIDENGVKMVTTPMTTNQKEKSGTLTFVNTVREQFTSAGQKKTITVHALFRDNTNIRVRLSRTITVQDCHCGCLVKIGTNSWLTLRCHNLGVDETADWRVPDKKLNGNYYQWGRTAAVATIDITNTEITALAKSPSDGISLKRWTESQPDPCTTELGSAWRLPTEAEWNLVHQNNDFISVGKFRSNTSTNTYCGELLVPHGEVDAQTFLPWFPRTTPTTWNGQGRYWSSTSAGDIGARTLVFDDEGIVQTNNYGKSELALVRCIAH